MARILELKAVRLNQKTVPDTDIFLAGVKIGHLIDGSYFDINWWEREKMGNREGQGYQRKPVENRIRKLANYLEKNKFPIFPTNILVCSREKIFYESSTGKILLGKTNKYPMWIVDGQTRVEGFKYAVEKLKMEEILDYEIPVIFLSGFEFIDELEQFFVLNSTQKRVSTDLAQRLKLELAKDDKSRFESLYPGQMWELKALKVIDELNRNPNSPWTYRIRLPNTSRSATTIISQNSFIQSLKPLYKEGGVLDGEKPDTVFEILKTYWNALQRIFPRAFQTPRDYVIQKTPGIFSLHNLAIVVIRKAMKEKIESNEYKLMLLLNQCFDKETSTDDFWRKDGNGAAVYGSMKGFRILSELFKNNFEKSI